MEDFETKTQEIIPNQESVKFVEEVREDVARTFPFISEDERNVFIAKLDAILEDKKILSDHNLLSKKIRVILASLNNTHTVLRENNKENQYCLDKYIYYKAEKFWINTKSGMVEIFSLNNVPIIDLITEKRKEIGGGTNDWQIGVALDEIMISNYETDVTLGTKEGMVKTRFVKRTGSKKREFVESRTLDGHIGYLNIASWSNHLEKDGKNVGEIIEEELQKIKENDSLIIDIRRNGGGNSNYAGKLAKHFIDRPMKFTDCLKRIPDRDGLEKKEFTIKPEGEFLDRKVVILTGPKCLSSSELFILMLKDTGRAITVGQTSGGGSGCPSSFPLHLGDKDYTLNVSTWRLIRNNGEVLENAGIDPDIKVEVTSEDVINHRDVELEKAIEYLKSKS